MSNGWRITQQSCYRNNAKRKMGNKNKGRHPALIIGELDDGKSKEKTNK